jgi:hypothetical protein
MRRVSIIPFAILALLPGGLPTLAAEPDVVVVQHVLISFKGKIPGKDITRSKDEAKELTLAVLDRAQTGEDFAALVEQNTDDRAPGIYKMSNRGVAQPPDGIKREAMVQRFGDISFRLAVGEIGIANYNAVTSPYGWHVIKRLE